MKRKYDKIIIGAGIYGLYAALHCGSKGQSVAVLEMDHFAFGRATYVNQARVHNGYHYPRSVSTALKSAGYFEKFNSDFSFCINREFSQVYATSNDFSWSSGEQFRAFCNAVNIPCEELNPNSFFKAGLCDAAFLTREYTYDAMVLKDYFLEKLSQLKNVEFYYGITIKEIIVSGSNYSVISEQDEFVASFVLNATYASVNQIIKLAGFEPFGIKYELCEIILCQVNDKLKEYGFTVMDGPFFSIMPFGKTESHSLTSVTFTPHSTSYSSLPSFDCQKKAGHYCSPNQLGNCNQCVAKPKSAFPYMSTLARKYLRDEYEFTYSNSLFSMKPILMASEIDDSRPTVIKTFSRDPTFISVLSGKINTVYDLNEVLDHEE